MANKTSAHVQPNASANGRLAAATAALSPSASAAQQQQQQQQPATTTTTNSSKKAKKKKAKRAAQAAAASAGGGLDGQDNPLVGGGPSQDDFYDDEDDLPELETPVSVLPASSFPYPPGGYPTSGLDGAMGAAFGGVVSGLDYSASGLSPSAHADLVNTATELYRRMEDPSFGETEEYWTSLPSHLRNFIRNALPISPSGAFPSLPPHAASPGGANVGLNAAQTRSSGQQQQQLQGSDGVGVAGGGGRPANTTMLAMAQQIVSAAHAGARNGSVLPPNAILPPGAFDPASLDFAFQPHPDHHHHLLPLDAHHHHPSDGGQYARNGSHGHGGYVTSAGVVMLDERDPEEYDRCV